MRKIILAVCFIGSLFCNLAPAENLEWSSALLVKINKAILKQQTEEWSRVPIDQIQRMAGDGNAGAQLTLGLKYHNSVSHEKEAQHWLHKAAEQYSHLAKQGDAHAQFILGWMYEDRMIFAPDGIEQSQQAEAWYLKAAEQDYADAQFKLGLLYSDKEYQDERQQAAIWFTKAADQYRKAAEQGDVYSAVNLAMMHMDGVGVTQDYGQTAAIFSKLADRGLAVGQNGLGVLYLEGLGVPHDATQAITLIRKAAEQGLGSAQYNLASIYIGELGDPAAYGLQKDYKLAYAWFLVAEFNGYEKASGIRWSLERSLSPAVVEEGTALAKGYFEKYRPIQ